MALILADRVKETSTTTGNGVFTLAGAASGFQSFAVIGNTNTTFYCIAGQGTNEWEVGIGTYASAGTTLTRTTVLSNSSATEPSALSFAAGTKDVFVTYPSEKSVNLDASGNATALGTPVAFTGTNITGTATSFTASNVTTNANLTGEATSVGNAATLTNSAVIGKVITGYVSGAGAVAATDTILQAIQKLNGNTAAVPGTVTSVSVVTNNGFAGTVATSTSTPAITLTTTVTGMLKGNSGSGVVSAGTSGTDYSLGTSALATGILKSTTATGALTIAIAADFPTLNQDTTGTASKTNALNSATTVVNVSSATAPTVGQYLIATSSTAATWQTPAAPAPFAATTAMIFKQTAAPTGWTKVLTNDNSALRVVTGTAGTGGSVAFTTAFASQAVAGTNGTSGATTLTTAQMPAHTHTVTTATFTAGGSITQTGNSAAGSPYTTSSTGGSGSHSHPLTQGLKFYDFIIAAKD